MLLSNAPSEQLGLLSDWQGFQPESSGKRVSLPTYPFADRRHWAADPSTVRRAFRPAVGLHPLIDTNESPRRRDRRKGQQEVAAGGQIEAAPRSLILLQKIESD